MSRRTEVINLVKAIVNDQTKAEMVVDTLTQEGLLHIGYGNKDIDAITESFKTAFGTTKTSRYDRFAAQRLAEKYGSQAVCGITKLLAERAGEQYAPIVGSVQQLEQKWVQVLNFVRTKDEGVLDV